MKQSYERDYATTPDWAIGKLLEMETFGDSILEPCCGKGAISEMLKGEGFNVVSSDIIDSVPSQIRRKVSG